VIVGMTLSTRCHDDNRAMRARMQRIGQAFHWCHGHKESSDQLRDFELPAKLA